ncbi:nuclear transport factor 2 family protein [Novosphingobium aquimarinum]|uniref:nuclear transport factor 2 family protein n=1 Tax=Novosphingobium aquimarinum TaxID=2682494 RepID=UPI0012EC3317|nr:nuclear transport factor 2 family protein [Novosphingobium aquimarinum]
MASKAIVETWVARYNASDAEGLAALDAPDAANHQVTQAPVQGRDLIRAMFAREFADMTCIPEAIHEAGDGSRWPDAELGGGGCLTGTAELF